MPVICRFYGLVIRMYLINKENNPPHVHVIYDEDYASIRIADGCVMDGCLPPKALSLAKEWIEKNKNALNKMWETQQFSILDPLK